MKNIIFKKDESGSYFYFFFKNSAQILMSILGASMVGTFTLLYALKSYSNIGDETYFFISFFVAALVSLKLYNRYRSFPIKKKLEIKDDKISFYHAETLIKDISLSDVADVSLNMERLLIFPLYSITIHGNGDEIKINGFKSGEDLDKALTNLKEIILRKNQV